MKTNEIIDRLQTVCDDLDAAISCLYTTRNILAEDYRQGGIMANLSDISRRAKLAKQDIAALADQLKSQEEEANQDKGFIFYFKNGECVRGFGKSLAEAYWDAAGGMPLELEVYEKASPEDEPTYFWGEDGWEPIQETKEEQGEA